MRQYPKYQLYVGISNSLRTFDNSFSQAFIIQLGHNIFQIMSAPLDTFYPSPNIKYKNGFEPLTFNYMLVFVQINGKEVSMDLLLWLYSLSSHTIYQFHNQKKQTIVLCSFEYRSASDQSNKLFGFICVMFSKSLLNVLSLIVLD